MPITRGGRHLLLYQQLTDGSLKILSTCQQLLADLRYYHPNERGQAVKKQDYLVDALCYAVMASPLYAKVKPTRPKKDLEMRPPSKE